MHFLTSAFEWRDGSDSMGGFFLERVLHVESRKKKSKWKGGKKRWKAINVVEVFWWKSLKMICLHNKHLFALFYVYNVLQQLHPSPDKAQNAVFVPFSRSPEISWRKFMVQFFIHILSDYFWEFNIFIQVWIWTISL